ncbi:RsmE family RNA methyltransferase [Compostibacter hankyongensis]|uniref:Ribosomal RNA small subunit methyltransferase E n=1 Tax=Compostibacter hankyongensis TaxID=1007089 RepID=A0ABP8G9M4_9BACT
MNSAQQKLPLFFTEQAANPGDAILLDEAASRHCTQVLRMREGDRMLLTDGKGCRMEAEILLADRRRTKVSIRETEMLPPPQPRLGIGIAFTKNTARMEWFLEKATEIGIRDIFPLLCARSQREKLRRDRFESILNAAMLQSRQVYLPQLHAPVLFADLVNGNEYTQRCIAWCGDGPKTPLQQALAPGMDTLVLIGPEGDFSMEEVELSAEQGFRPVSLGPNRLRTETAGIVACTLMNAARL